MAKDERIHLRVDGRRKRLFEAASAVSNRTVSAFIVDAATEEAERVLADRHVFRLDAEQWRAFDEMQTRGPRDVPGLQELMTNPTILDGQE